MRIFFSSPEQWRGESEAAGEAGTFHIKWNE